MKNIFSKMLLITVCLLTIFTVVSAQPLNVATTKTISTKFTLANLGTSAANVTVDYYKPDGSAWTASAANTNFTIGTNFSQKSIAQWDDGTLTTGTGAVVVSSDQPLGSVVEVWARPPQTISLGAYVGVANGDNTIVLPQVFKDRFSASGTLKSQIFIQNIGTASTTVSVAFYAYPGTGNDYTKTGITIAPGASYSYDITEESGLVPTDSTGWSGSAIVDAAGTTDQIAVVVNSFAGDKLITYNGIPFTWATTTWIFPQYASRLANGYTSNVIYVNVSGGTFDTGTVHLVCKRLDSSYTPETFDVANLAPLNNNVSLDFNSYTRTSDIPGLWSGSCKLTAPGNVVAYTIFRRPSSSYQDYSADVGGTAGQGSTKVMAPVMAKRMSDGFATTAYIRNLDESNDAHVDVYFERHPDCVVGSAEYIVSDQTVPMGSNLEVNLRTTGGVGSVLPDGWFGAMIVKPNAGYTARNLIMRLQITSMDAARTGDRYAMYVGIAVP